MSKTLVIVESPAKAKTISKYLGSDYIVNLVLGISEIFRKVSLKNQLKEILFPKTFQKMKKED